jgi:hypothetical protein
MQLRTSSEQRTSTFMQYFFGAVGDSSVWRQILGQMTNWRRFGEKAQSSNRCSIPEVPWRAEENHEKP